jgi:hypothetical protein
MLPKTLVFWQCFGSHHCGMRSKQCTRSLQLRACNPTKCVLLPQNQVAKRCIQVQFRGQLTPALAGDCHEFPGRSFRGSCRPLTYTSQPRPFFLFHSVYFPLFEGLPPRRAQEDRLAHLAHHQDAQRTPALAVQGGPSAPPCPCEEDACAPGGMHDQGQGVGED